MERKHVSAGSGAALPAPSPELVLIGVFVRSHLRTCHLKSSERREAFIRETEATFELFEREAKVTRFRPPADRRAVLQARELAAAWYAEALSLLAG